MGVIAEYNSIEDKYVVKVFNWSEFHLSEMTLLQNPYFNWSAKIWVCDRPKFNNYVDQILPNFDLLFLSSWQ